MSRFQGLWRHPDFLRLWGGQSISILGSSITSLALPTTAILVLHANPFEVGLLIALARLPFPILALGAGAWVDRVRRRPLMIGADIGRLFALGSIPPAAALGVLTLYQLYAVALITGVFTVFFDIAYLAYVPSLVGREAVVEANTKLQFSGSVTSLAGPSLAGLLIQLVGSARAITLDAASFLVSSVTLLSIQAPEPQSVTGGRSGVKDISEGLGFVFRHPLLRALCLLVGASIFGFHAAESAEYPFFLEQLRLSPGTVGLIFSAGGVGALAGVFLTSRLIRTLGVGPAIGYSGLAMGVATCALALAAVWPAIPTLVLFVFLVGLLDPVHNVTQQSLRQGLTPDSLQGRMSATFRTVYWGAWPLGNLVGGSLAAHIGLVPTILFGGAWGAMISLLVFATPLRGVREHPTRLDQ